jgi:hypothetical protein
LLSIVPTQSAGTIDFLGNIEHGGQCPPYSLLEYSVMDEALRSRPKEALIQSIQGYFKRRLAKGNSTINILDTLFPTERRIRSLIGGLETSMGTVFWEAIAKELAKDNGFEVIEESLLVPDPFPHDLQSVIDELCNLRAKGNFISTDECVAKIRQTLNKISFKDHRFILSKKKGHGVDLRIRKGGIEYLFDIKSPRPNVGDFPRYCRQLLDWYAHKLSQDKFGHVEARIAFTSNPYNKSWYETEKTKISTHLDPSKDILVGNEFWDFCSDYHNTLDTISDLLAELREQKFHLEFYDIFYGHDNH